MLPLACTVRGCGVALVPCGRAFRCSAGHTFDVARSGYLNLLQPQDRRSARPGDGKAAVDARANLLDRGVGAGILREVVVRAAALASEDDSVIVEVGSGSGHLLGALALARAIRGIGIDLSIAAADAAARRFPDLEWIVANADRRIPLLDRSAHLLLSLHARRNAAECARVLVPEGFLLVGIPAPDDLIELRTAAAGQAAARDRSADLIREHDSRFALRDRVVVREQHRLERPALLALLRATYRGARHSAASRLNALIEMDVTLATELLVFALREQGTGNRERTGNEQGTNRDRGSGIRDQGSGIRDPLTRTHAVHVRNHGGHEDTKKVSERRTDLRVLRSSCSSW